MAYHERGARFAKWRAVIDIADGVPTAAAVRANAHALARYAGLCQAVGIAPIVEPEVLMDGAHDIDRCDEVTRFVLQSVFEELFEQRVALEGMILKPNMVIAGKKSDARSDVEQVAERTVAAGTRAFNHRARMNGLASLGQWAGALEKAA